MYNTRRISEKKAVIILSIGVVLFFSFWGYYFYTKNNLFRKTELQLATILKDRSDRIFALLDQISMQGNVRAADPKIIEMFNVFQVFKPEEFNSEQYQEQAEHLRHYLKEKSSETFFNNTMLISPQGVVLFSDWAPEYVGKDLDKKPYSNFALAQSCIRARMSLTTDIGDFAYDPFLKRSILFITIPIMYKDTFIGLLIQSFEQERLFAISDDYVGLGITGDLVVGKKIDAGVLLLTRSRVVQNSPLKKFIFADPFSQEQNPLILGTSGYNGYGLTLDFMQRKAVASWRFIPEFNWGIVATITQDEVGNILGNLRVLGYLFLFLLFLLIVGITTYFSWLTRLYQIIFSSHYQALFQRISLGIVCLAAAITIFIFMHNRHIYGEKIKARAQDTVKMGIASIEHYLKEIETVGEELAFDLGAERIPKEEILSRVKQELKQHPDIYGITIAYEPYKYDEKKRLYAPYVVRTEHDYEISFLEDSYDYTKQIIAPEGLEAETQSWYAQAIKQRTPVHFDPYIADPAEKKLLGMFSVPFYRPNDKNKEHALGVVNMVFELDAITTIVKQITLGSTGYAFLASQRGIFISYPIENYVTLQKSMRDLAGLQASEELLAMVNNSLQRKTGNGPYEDKASEQSMWAFYSVISSTGWPLFLVVAADEMDVSPIAWRHYFITLLLLGMCLAFISMWFFASYQIMRHLKVHILMAVCFLVLFILFIIIRSTTIFQLQQNEQETVITSDVTLDKYLYDVDRYYKYVNEEIPIKVPFGISVFTIDILNQTTLEITGYVWLKYPKKIGIHARREPQFPQAIKPVTLKKMFEVKETGFEVIGWQFTARLAQDFNFKTYPLDLIPLRIDVEYPDSTRNIMLVPALDDYKNILPEKMPGSYSEISVPGFRAIKSFFSFNKETSSVNFGLDMYQTTSDQSYLSYHYIFKRTLLYELIVFIVPLFIIFLLLYSLAWVAEKEWLPIMILSGYTGLLFSTILLHRTLRDLFITSEILFLEYPFFMVYLVIVLLVFYMLYKLYFDYQESPIHKFFNFYKTYFWSLQLLLLFIITLFNFYSP